MDLRFRNWTYIQTSFWLKNRHTTSSSQARFFCRILVNLISISCRNNNEQIRYLFLSICSLLIGHLFDKKKIHLVIIVITAHENFNQSISSLNSELFSILHEWKALFQGKAQPWRLGKFFGDVSFAVGHSGEGFEKELEGAILQPAQKVDRFVSKELMNNLFNSKKWSKMKQVNLQGNCLKKSCIS